MEYLDSDWDSGFAFCGWVNSRAASISIDDFYLTAADLVCSEERLGRTMCRCSEYFICVERKFDEDIQHCLVIS